MLAQRKILCMPIIYSSTVIYFFFVATTKSFCCRQYESLTVRKNKWIVCAFLEYES